MSAYTYNMVCTVLELSAAEDWETASREWEVTDCEVDENCSGVCVCGKENLRYLYTITNRVTGAVLYPIGSSCIQKFMRDDLDEASACWQQAFALMDEAVRLGKKGMVEIDSGFFSRKLLYFLYEQGAFPASKYNDGNGYNDYLFLLGAFNGKALSEKQERKCRAVIRYSVYPWLRRLWKENRFAKNG